MVASMYHQAPTRSEILTSSLVVTSFDLSRAWSPAGDRRVPRYPGRNLFVCASPSRSPMVRAKYAQALLVLRSLYDDGFRTQVSRQELQHTIMRVLDVVDRRTIDSWIGFLFAHGHITVVSSKVFTISFPASIEVESFAQEEEERR